MKKVGLFLLCLILLLYTAGCASEEDELYNSVLAEVGGNNDADPTYAFDTLTLTPPYYPELAQRTPVPGDTLSGELLIKAFREVNEPPEVYWLAREFMELHPNVTITLNFDNAYYEILQPDELAMRETKFYTKVQMELAAGEADYLLFGVSNDLDLYTLSQSGVLQDMRERWETDPDIDHDRCLSGVIDGFLVDGKLTVMPYAFSLPSVFLNREILEELGIQEEDISAVSTADILDWYGQARERHPDLQLLFNGQDKELLFDVEKLRYIDPDSGAVSFCDPDFYHLLDCSATAILNPPVLSDTWSCNIANGLYMNAACMYRVTGEIPVSINMVERAGYPNYAKMVRTQQVSLAVLDEIGIYDVHGFAKRPLDYLAGPFPVTSSDGQLGISTNYADFIMPSSLKNADLAWEFIKFCLSDREKQMFEGYGFTGCFFYSGGSLPINKNNLEAQVEYVRDYRTDDGIPGGGIVGYDQFHTADTTGEEIVARLEEILSHNPVSTSKYNVDVQEFLDEFYFYELTTPEQCAKKIQERVMIWLNE